MASHLESHQKYFRDSLQKMKENDVISDVTLILPDESSIQCHKLVLMASSPFFERMFQSGLKEGAEKDVKLDFADADTIRTLIDFFYSGEIQVTEDNIKVLVEASEFLCCEHLKAHCDEYLAGNVRSSNYADLYKFSKLFNLGMVLVSAFGFILGHFKDFMETSDFDELTEDELLKVVSDDGLNAENEDIVFEAVLQWLNVDLDLRKEVFPRVAPLIRFPFCSTASLTHKICNNQLGLDSGCIGLVHEALKSQHHCNSHSAIHNARFVPRRAFTGKKQRLIRIIESPKYNNGSYFDYTDRIDGAVEWTKNKSKIASDLNQTFASPTGIYLVNDQTCHLLVVETPIVTAIPWISATGRSTLAFIGEKFVAFGGCNEQNMIPSKSVESFELKEANPKWKSEQVLYSPCVIQFENKVLVLGGCAAEGPSKVTQEFDTVMSKWQRRSDIPGSFVGGTAVALNDKIYVVGGAEQVCYSYNPAKDEWKVLSKPPGEVGRCSTTTTWNGKIIHGSVQNVQQYDPENDSWSAQNQLKPSAAYRMRLHTLCF